MPFANSVHLSKGVGRRRCISAYRLLRVAEALEAGPRVGSVRPVASSSADLLRRSYLGGMRWGHNLNATFPFARLVVASGGVIGGPSAKLLGGLVPTLEYRWEDLAQIEPVSWFVVPFIADGVRFLTEDAGFIFWTGSGRRSRGILEVCAAAAPRLVSRERRWAPLINL